MTKGGKGIGRLSWLKIFRKISVESTFKKANRNDTISFDFVLRPENQIAIHSEKDFQVQSLGTTVILMDFLDSFGTKCPVKTDTIVQRIIAHFLPIFAGDKSPSIFLKDNVVVNLKNEFKEKTIESKDEMIDIEIEGVSQPIIVRHMK